MWLGKEGGAAATEGSGIAPCGDNDLTAFRAFPIFIEWSSLHIIHGFIESVPECSVIRPVARRPGAHSSPGPISCGIMKQRRIRAKPYFENAFFSSSAIYPMASADWGRRRSISMKP